MQVVNKQVTSRRLILSAILAGVLAVVAFQPSTAAGQSAGMDHPAVRVAANQVGNHGGQCKMFVRQVFARVGANIGPGYRAAYLNVGTEIDPANARAGDILQISHPANGEAFYPGMHTAIVIENLGNGTFKVVDSNFGGDERVRIHNWTPRVPSHLRLYAYRIDLGATGSSSSGSSGSSSNSSPAADVPEAPDLAVGDEAIVATGTSCLNMRDGAGLNHSRIDCMESGGKLTVLSEPTSSNGFTWVKVQTESGQEGWVAAEYLRPAPSEDVPDAPELSLSQQATVDTDGSCLYVRDGAGLLKSVKDCMSDGTVVDIVSQPVRADGFTWVEVELSNGTRGWSASEYLVSRE